jgi:Flp pilus assembly protein TadD
VSRIGIRRPSKAAKVCQNCGTKVGAGHARCPRCRAVLATTPDVPQFNVNRWMSVALAALAVVAVVTVAALWPRGEEEIAARPAQSNYQEALSLYRAALDRDPNDSETLSNLGQVLVRLGRTEEALPLFQRAITLAPDRWAYRFNLARAHGLLGNWNDAVAEYQAARQLFPNDYATEFNLGLALHKAGKEADAVDAYARAIALEPNDPSFHMALGTSYEKLQRTGEAAAAYIRYVELAPDAPDADRVRARILQLANASQTSASAVSR